jgi:hypothetical protein
MEVTVAGFTFNSMEMFLVLVEEHPISTVK